MRTVSTAVEIEASPMEIWAVLTDLASYEEWNPQIRRGVGDVVAGARVQLEMSPPGGRPFTIRPRVIAATPGKELRLRGRVPGIFSGEHFFLLADTDTGTAVTQGETFRGVVVPFIGKTIVAAEEGFRAHNEALRKRVEAGGPWG